MYYWYNYNFVSFSIPCLFVSTTTETDSQSIFYAIDADAMADHC